MQTNQFCPRCLSGTPKPGDAYCKSCMAERMKASLHVWEAQGRIQSAVMGQEKPMPSEKTTPVPDWVLRDIRAVMGRPVGQLASGGPVLTLSGQVPGDLRALLQQLPAPPPLDPVEECAKAYADEILRVPHQLGIGAIKAALRRYRELGCPELP